MKRTVAFILLLASAFALCAFGGAAPTADAAPAVVADLADTETEEPVLPEEYEPFRDVLEALAAGEYDAAEALIEKMKPEPEKPESSEIVEIKITKDNFLDYFKYTSDFKPARSIEKNSKGKVVGFYLRPGYVLKDGYKVASDSEHESKVEVGVKYKLKWYYPAKKNVKIDFKKFTYKVTGKAYSTDKIDEMREGWHYYIEESKEYTFYIPLSYSTSMSYKDNWSCAVPKKEVQLVSAKGTLYLYADSLPGSEPAPAEETAPVAETEPVPAEEPAAEIAPEAAAEPAAEPAA